jgi:1-deoxy-D-xylulose-5-phosphate synthase
LGVPLLAEPEPLPLGKGEILREGSDIALLAVGAAVQPAREAAELLAREGLSAQVINMRFIKPLDEALLEKVWQEQRLVLTLEENSLVGGFGAAVLEWAARSGAERDLQVVNLGIPDHFQEHGARAELLAAVGLQAEQIRERILAILEGGERKRSARSAS